MDKRGRDTSDYQKKTYYAAKKGYCRSCKKRKARPGRAICIVCNKRKLDWYHANKETSKKNGAAYRRKLKLEAFNAYGGPKCSCCGEDHLEFLSLDHINGKGAAHRRAIKKGGYAFYGWLKGMYWPKGYRVLCMNCNFALGVHGYCPHQQEQLHVA